MAILFLQFFGFAAFEFLGNNIDIKYEIDYLVNLVIGC